jgi:hypothetical protein
MSSEIVPVEPGKKGLTLPDQEWSQIVEQLISELDTAELPDDVIQATEMLLAGFPTYKVARKLSKSTDTIRRWLSKYPTMAMVVSDGRKLLAKWRMSKLEQQFLTAIERSQEILEVDLSGISVDDMGLDHKVDPKVLTVVAAQARYMIGLFAGQKVDITVTHEVGDTVMKAKQDALNYIAERLAEQEANAELEPIEATIRVIDTEIDNNAPVLDENGNPPFGKLGEFAKSEAGTQCHICGKFYKYLAKHLLTEHNLTTEEYELTYMLEDGAVRKADAS